ncbi:CDP-alcohol phosphatidyltransferase family protein [Roseomonas sp. GCM10028921]
MGQAPRRFRFTPRKLGPRERPRLGGLSFNRLLPNLLTMLGLCAGMTAIRFAIEARWEPAVTLIVVAAFIDGIDGRLARLLQATSRFGAEFDSLSDFLCFGVAPAFILFLWTLHDARGLGFIPCLLFAACMALRLARFNAAIDAPAAPGTVPRPAGFFTGVPAPAGAGLALFPIFAALTFEGWGLDRLAAAMRHPIFSTVLLVAIAGLLVSTLPTWSFKKVKIPRQAVLLLMLGAAAYAALLVAEPWAALAAAGFVYMGMIPFSLRSYRQKLEAARLAMPTEAEGPAA